MAMPLELKDEEKRVLRVLRERATDGYSVMSSTGLSPQKLRETVERLREHALLEVKGDVSENRIGEAYLFVPPSSKGLVDFLIGGVRAR